MLPFIAPVYAVVISVAIYLGVRVFVGRRKKQIQKAIGEGMCAVCGQKIVNNKCQQCDSKNQT